jgi:hypothetical protein
MALLEQAKREGTIGKKFLLLATIIELDPWTVAEEKAFTPWVIILMIRIREEGQLLYQMPI